MFYGGPGRSPTCDLRVRSALLYATELPGHVWLVYRVGFKGRGDKLEGGEFMPDIVRRHAVTVNIGGIRVGSDAPVVVQSMTNTDTADVESTVQQVAALARAGSEMVRVTVNNDDAAKAVPAIVAELAKKGWSTPIIDRKSVV